MIEARLERSLGVLAEAARSVEGDWWMIGSAAAVLSGAALDPEDVDVFGAPEVVRGLLAALGAEEVPVAAHERFRSAPYQRVVVDGGLPLELMGGTVVLVDGEWEAFKLETRRVVSGAWGEVFVPEVAEQVAILNLFGREKDLAKVGVLEGL